MKYHVLSWTIVVRRFDGSGDYNRNWNEYKQGFGDASGEYWLGNEYLHYMTSSRAYKLRFDLEDWDGNTAYAEYYTFHVNSESDNYRLILDFYSGNASASTSADLASGLGYHNNNQFSTYDRDNDNWVPGSCSINHGNNAGFWFNACDRVNTNDARQALFWEAWKMQPLKKIAMMFRP